MKPITLKSIEACFNGDTSLSADEIAIRLGREPGKTWQQNLAAELKSGYRIVPGRSYVNKKRARVYRKADFQDDGQGRAVGSPGFRAQAKSSRRDQVDRLSVKCVLRELDRIGDGLEADGVSAKEWKRRIRAAIKYEIILAERSQYA